MRTAAIDTALASTNLSVKDSCLRGCKDEVRSLRRQLNKAIADVAKLQQENAQLKRDFEHMQQALNRRA